MSVQTTQPETIPLVTDEHGVIRIAGSRITLDLIACAWRTGATPERIVDQYPSLQLDDVYAVITWMLRHPNEVAAYLAQGEQEAAELQRQMERFCPAESIRARLASRSTKT